MKKILSTIVAALVAVSFASVVFAYEGSYSEHDRDARGTEIRRENAKPMNKHYKPIKHRKQIKFKKQIRMQEQHQR